MVPTSPGKSWKLMEFEKRPGKSWNFAEILENSWKSPGIFLWSNSPKGKFLSKHQHFLGFLCILNQAVHWLTAVIFIWGILDPIMSIYSQHITGWWYSNLNNAIKSLILELQNCMSNTSTTVHIVFDSSPFGRC